MQKSGATPTSNATPFFSSFSFGGGSSSRSRPGTASGEPPPSSFAQSTTPQLLPSATLQPPNVLTKDRDRKGSFGRKASFSSPNKSKQRRAGSSSTVITDSNVPPALPDFALAAAAKLSRETDVIQSPASGDSFSKMMTRGAPAQDRYGAPLPALPVPPQSAYQTEGAIVHQQVQAIANKRISTLDYLRKA